jgi:hypothetical protein
MKVTITAADARYARDEGSVIVITGREAETGDLVTFAGDHRVMRDMLEAFPNRWAEPVTAEVETWQVTARVPLRKGRIRRTPIGGPTGEVAGRYLPHNYQVTEVTDEWVLFEGHDTCGWTLDDYVIPRLASGLIWAEEVTS